MQIIDIVAPQIYAKLSEGEFAIDTARNMYLPDDVTMESLGYVLYDTEEAMHLALDSLIKPNPNPVTQEELEALMVYNEEKLNTEIIDNQTILRENSLIEIPVPEAQWDADMSYLPDDTVTDKYSVYRATKYSKDVQPKTNSDEWEVIAPVKLENIEFTGENYINTDLRLLDEPFNGFTIILKYNKDTSPIADDEYRTILHCMDEKSPYHGITIQSYNPLSSTGSTSVDIGLQQNFRFTYQEGLTEINDESIQYVILTSTSDYEFVFKHLSSSKELVHYVPGAKNSAPTDDIDYQFQTLYVGCANILGETDRFFKGTIHNLLVYKRPLSEEEITTILDTI